MTSAPQPFSCAIRAAIFIIIRRITTVKMSSGQLSRMASWISVKGTTASRTRPHQADIFLQRVRTFSSANSLV